MIFKKAKKKKYKEKLVILQSIGIIVRKQGWSPTYLHKVDQFGGNGLLKQLQSTSMIMETHHQYHNLAVSTIVPEASGILHSHDCKLYHMQKWAQ